MASPSEIGQQGMMPASWELSRKGNAGRDHGAALGAALARGVGAEIIATGGAAAGFGLAQVVEQGHGAAEERIAGQEKEQPVGEAHGNEGVGRFLASF